MTVYQSLQTLITTAGGSDGTGSDQSSLIAQLNNLITVLTPPIELAPKATESSGEISMNSQVDGETLDGEELLRKQERYLQATLDALYESREALDKIERIRDSALDRIGTERALATNTISGKLDGAVEALSNALAHALAGIGKATAEMDRKRMGYGNPKNQDD